MRHHAGTEYLQMRGSGLLQDAREILTLSNFFRVGNELSPEDFYLDVFRSALLVLFVHIHRIKIAAIVSVEFEPTKPEGEQDGNSPHGGGTSPTNHKGPLADPVPQNLFFARPYMGMVSVNRGFSFD